jgi:8-oxo-dGTP pyrophosphatase MutT (NUDIX family)
LPISPYLAGLRAKVGHDLLVLPAVAVVVRDRSNRLLLVRDRASASWGLPAGAVEPAETPREAARRELLEESGIDCNDLELAAALGGREFRHEYANGDLVEYAVFVFRGTVSLTEVPARFDTAEVVEARFFSRESAPELAMPYPPDLLWSEPAHGLKR